MPWEWPGFGWFVVTFLSGFMAGGVLGMPFVITTGQAKSLIKKWEDKYGTKDGKSILNDKPRKDGRRD